MTAHILLACYATMIISCVYMMVYSFGIFNLKHLQARAAQAEDG